MTAIKQAKGATRVAIPTREDNGAWEARVTYTGVTPLMVQRGMADPMDPLARERVALSDKKASKRTADDNERLSRIEWELSIYHDANIGPYVPAAWLRRSLRDSAARWRLGMKVKEGMQVTEPRIPLIYDGPRDLDGLWDAGFRDVRGVVNAGQNSGRVLRTRPRFDSWSIEFALVVERDELDTDQVARIIGRAQHLGIGSGRPGVGGAGVGVDMGLFRASMEVVT